MSSATDSDAHQDAFERIAPVVPPPLAKQAPAEPPPAASPGFSARGVVLALVALLLLAAVLFGWLSQREPPTPTTHAEPTAPAPVAAVEKSTAQTSVEPRKSAEDILNDPDSLRRRQAAQTARKKAESLTSALKQQAVEQWAGAPFATVVGQMESAERAFEAREFAAAQKQFEATVLSLEKLQSQVASVLDQAIQRGITALENADGIAAAQAFELALAIETENAQAKRGMQRVAVLDQVLETLRGAESAENAGQIQAAYDAYDAAVQLDPDNQTGQSGRKRMQATLNNRAYQQSVASGLSALDAGDVAGARAAFQKALKLQPGGEAAREGLARVGALQDSARIAELLQQASNALAAEQWSDAVSHYQSALKIDPNLVEAGNGLEAAQARATLDQKMKQFIDQPQRLHSASVRQAADALLQHAQSISPAGPVLQQQMAQLQSAIALATTPVTVAFASDGQTQVTLYKVGDLGRFDRKSLSLKPGKYVAVGVRPGYRDVRKSFEVSAQSSNAPIVIRCEEPI